MRLPITTECGLCKQRYLSPTKKQEEIEYGERGKATMTMTVVAEEEEKGEKVDTFLHPELWVLMAKYLPNIFPGSTLTG